MPAVHVRPASLDHAAACTAPLPRRAYAGRILAARPAPVVVKGRVSCSLPPRTCSHSSIPHPAPVATSMEAAAESTAATEYLHWIVSITVTTTVTVAVTVAVTVGT